MANKTHEHLAQPSICIGSPARGCVDTTGLSAEQVAVKRLQRLDQMYRDYLMLKAMRESIHEHQHVDVT